MLIFYLCFSSSFDMFTFMMCTLKTREMNEQIFLFFSFLLFSSFARRWTARSCCVLQINTKTYSIRQTVKVNAHAYTHTNEKECMLVSFDRCPHLHSLHFHTKAIDEFSCYFFFVKGDEQFRDRFQSLISNLIIQKRKIRHN